MKNMRTTLVLLAALLWSVTASGQSGTYADPYPCDREYVSSGSADQDDTWWQMGLVSGTFKITYDMYALPDSLDVYYEGNLVYTTGGQVSGSNTVSIAYGPGSDTRIKVVVNAGGNPDGGTYWSYQLECATTNGGGGNALVIETDQPIYHIDTTPKMPAIRATLRSPGVTTGNVRWTAEIQYDPKEFDPKYGPARSDLGLMAHGAVLPINKEFVPKFLKIRGGKLILHAALVGGTATATSDKVRIVADNPSQAQIESAFPANFRGVLSLIARHESTYQQFQNGYPLWSHDHLGGVGVMQITNPKPSADEVWDWRKNAKAGVRKFTSVATIANRYWMRVNKSPAFAALVADFNAQRKGAGLPAIKVTLPMFTKGNFNGNYQQFEMMAVRAYNGAAGLNELLDTPLQEFTLATVDSLGEDLLITVNEKLHTGQAAWQRVPAEDRPQNVGDPNYVFNVLGL